MQTLVVVFRTQSRLVEAIDTGRSLCRVAEEAMNPNHPETLKAEAEFASSLRSAGDYKAAEAQYAKTVAKSRQEYADDPEHPEALRYASELAHTYVCIGRLEDAETLALETMFEIVLKWRRKTLGEFHNLTLVSEYDLGMANRECNRLEEARQEFQTVFSQRCIGLGNTHPDTLAAKRALIITRSALSRWDDNLNCDKSLQDVEEEEGTSLLKSSVMTLSEHSDDSSSRTTSSEPSPSPSLSPPESTSVPPKPMSLDDWTSIEKSSRAIALEQESRIGADHPETINTLLWVLAVQLLVGKIVEASET
ncbi:hypothetical protein B0H66DRAFT_491325, partial [Apodospora peruviana]